MAELTPAPARAEDLQEVQMLLQTVGLPTDGVSDAFPHGYAVVREGPVLVGVAGLEVYADLGLLRSVGVAAGQRGRGLGRALVDDRLRAARQQRLTCIYLLTTTAAVFFKGVGFSVVDRAAVHPQIQQARELTSICPASATCLSLVL